MQGVGMEPGLGPKQGFAVRVCGPGPEEPERKTQKDQCVVVLVTLKYVLRGESFWENRFTSSFGT